MLREKGTLNTKDAPQLPLSLTPRWGGALAQKQEVGGSCVPWQAQEVLWWLK